MSSEVPRKGRIRVTTGDQMVPVEVRDRYMHLMAHELGDREFSLDPGLYLVSAHIPGGHQFAEPVVVGSGDVQSVDFTPELGTLAPRFWYGPAFASDAEGPPVERAAFPLDWSFRFLRLEDLSHVVREDEAIVREVKSRQGVLTVRIEVRESPIFVQIARSAEVPLNVALPASRRGSCILVAEEQAGALCVNALPVASRIRRIAQFLAAGENRHAALLIDVRTAGRLLQRESVDPVSAAVGGYALLRLGDLERTRDWAENLAAWFEWLPDGAVIAGERSAMLGDHLRALEYFLQAGKRGLPLFTDGFSFLVSRLRQYQSNVRIRTRLTDDQVTRVRTLSSRLEEWSPFVDFSAVTLTFRAADIFRPAESQHVVDPRLPQFSVFRIGSDGRLEIQRQRAIPEATDPRPYGAPSRASPTSLSAPEMIHHLESIRRSLQAVVEQNPGASVDGSLPLIESLLSQTRAYISATDPVLRIVEVLENQVEPIPVRSLFYVLQSVIVSIQHTIETESSRRMDVNNRAFRVMADIEGLISQIAP